MDYLDRKRRPHRWAGRGRALALAVGLTLLLLVLASAVFSIAGRSRDVASRSVTLHSLNESLRAATVVRAQVTFAAYLAANDAANGTNSKADIAVAVAEARRNLVDLRSSFANSDPTGLPDAETRTALGRFSTAAGRALDLAAGSRPSSSRIVVRSQLVPSFVVLRDRLTLQRDNALADVRTAGATLGRLGGLASFVIAFVLPTVTVLVYRQVTRRSRESVEIARSLALAQGRARRRQELLNRSLATIQDDFGTIEAADPDTRLAVVRRIGWDLDALKTVISGAGQLAFAATDLGQELQAVAASLRGEGARVSVSSAEGVAWADGPALETAVRYLVLEAEDMGARDAELGSSTRDGFVEIRVAHDGRALTPAVAALVFERAHDSERASVEAGAAPMRLLAAQELLEAMGGSLAHDLTDNRPAFLARLPRGRVVQPLVPAEAPKVTVAPA